MTKSNGNKRTITASKRWRSTRATRPIRRPARAPSRFTRPTAYQFRDTDHAAALFGLQERATSTPGS